MKGMDKAEEGFLKLRQLARDADVESQAPFLWRKSCLENVEKRWYLLLNDVNRESGVYQGMHAECH